MKVYDNFCKADEGKQFVLTHKGKDECVSYSYKEVGKPVDEYNEVPHWAFNNGYVIETDIPGWVIGLKGYKVGYYHNNGMFLHCGNPQVFPTLKAAKVYAKHYGEYSWFHEDKNIIIEETTYNGIPLSESKTFNGREVVDNEHYFGLNAHEIGEYFATEVVEWFRDCVPPAWCSSELVQCGEPNSSRIDENGICHTTYSTFKRIAEGIWQYCGDCFKGENYIHGTEPTYV